MSNFENLYKKSTRGATVSPGQTQAPTGGGFEELMSQTTKPTVRPEGAPQTSTRPRPRPEQPEDNGNPILSFLADAGSTVIDNLPAAAYLMTRSATPAIDRAIDAASTPAESGGEAFEMIGSDRGAMGNLDVLADGRARAAALLGGEGQDAADTAGRKARTDVNFNLAEARRNHQLAALGGDVVGSVAVGIPFTMGANALLGAGRATGSVMLAAGAEEGLYSLASGTTATEAGTDAALAAATAGVGKKLFDVGGGVLRILRGAGTKELEKELGAQVLTAMRARHASETGQVLSLEDAIKIVDDNPDKVLSDLYPDLAPRLKTLVMSGSEDARERAATLLAGRNDLTFNYRDAMLKAIGADDVPTPTQYTKMLDAQQADLRPKYSRLFDNMDAAKYHMKRGNVKDYIYQDLDESLTSLDLDNQIIQRVTNSIGDGDKLTFRQLNEMRKAFNEEIFQRIRQNNAPGNTQRLPIKNLQAAKGRINWILRQNDQFRTLQDTYGDIEEAKLAHKFGMDIIRKTGLDSADAEIFLKSQKSDRVVDAFINGAKYQMYSYAKNPKNPATALKEGRLDDLRAVVGDEYVDAITKKTEEIINFENTKTALKEGMNRDIGLTGGSGQGTRSLSQAAIDARITKDLFTGQATGTAPNFALGRMLKAAQGEALPTGGELERATKIGIETFMQPGGANRVLEALQPSNMPTGKQLGGFAFGSMVRDSEPANRAGEALGQGAEAGYQAIMDYLNSTMQ